MPFRKTTIFLMGLVFGTVVTLAYHLVFVSNDHIHKNGLSLKSILEFSSKHKHKKTHASPETNNLDISNQLCRGNGIKPVFSKSTKVLSHLDFRKEKLEFLENFKNPCFYRNVTFYNKKHVAAPVTKLRCLPYFFIVGMPKCGTTDIWAGLVLHPDVVAHHVKETFYVTKKRFPPDNWSLDQYLDMFHKTTEKIASSPSPDKWFGEINQYPKITGEGTVDVLFDNDNWNLIPGNDNCNEPRVLNAHYLHHLNPNLNLIVILRNPVERLYSDYIYLAGLRGHRVSVIDFHQAVLKTIQNQTDCRKYFSERGCAYNKSLETVKARLRIGMYHVFLEDWLRVFPAEQMMIIRFEDFVIQRVHVMQDIFKFLNLRPLSREEETNQENRRIENARKKIGKDIGDMMNETRIVLETFYEPFNQRLATLLNDKKYLWKT